MLYRLSLLLIALLIGTNAWSAESNYFHSDQTKVVLISEADQIQPGEEFWIGLKFEQSPGWHIYWENPGDSGVPPKLEWEDHSDVVFDSELHWESPDLIVLDQLIDYGYRRNSIVLPVKAYLKKDFSGPEIEIKLGADWLICKVDCIPQSQTFVLKLPVGSKQLGKNFDDFQNSFKHQAIQKDLTGKLTVNDHKLTISLNQLPPIKGKPFLVFKSPSISTNNLEQQFTHHEFTLTKAPENLEIPAKNQALLLDLDSNHLTQSAYQVNLSHESITPQLAQNLAAQATSSTKQETFNLSKLAYLLAIALLGGILLNLMPCVFPIISIKLLDFLEIAAHDKRIARRHALCFAAGIISLMLVLAILAEALKYFGQNIGWGFQLQSPIFVSLLIIIFYLIALSFAGYYSFGNSLMSKTAAIKTDKSYLGSFFNGALATLVATPCSAPFMGTALGATLSLDIFSSLLIFLSLGLGISLPFVILTFNQQLTKKLPRPGAWMEKLKQILSFLMFATCLWLLWVLQSLASGEYLIWVLFSLLLIALFLWIRENWQPTIIGWKIIRYLILSFLAVAIIFPLLFPTPNSQQTDNGQSTNNPYHLPYQKFSEEVLKAELSKGKSVYIDFTARWCLTCQVNKKRVFSSSEIIEYFTKNNVSLLVADWTNKNQEIKDALNKYGRNSVPLNIIYGKNNEEYKVLPSLLSAQEVLSTFRELNSRP